MQRREVLGLYMAASFASFLIAESSLAQVQGWSEVGAGRALFETHLVFENYPVDAPGGAPTATWIGGIRTSQSTNYPLTLIVVPGSELLLRVMHDSESYAAASVVQMLAHLRSVLEVIAACYHSAAIGRRVRLDGVEARALSGMRMGAPPVG